MARPDKVEAVKEIAGRFKAAEAALLTDYRGLRVGDIAEVRNALRAADCEYKVLKNTLTRIAVREVGLDELVAMLEGPTAVAFCAGDAAAAAKALDDAAKKFPVLIIKGGVLAGKIIGADEAKRLAQLEPREVQLTKIAMLMNAPIQQTANVLSALLRDLGSMLAQVVAQKEAEAPPGEAEAPPEEPVAQTTGADEATPAEEAGDQAAPEEQPSTETLDADGDAGGAEAAEEAEVEDASEEPKEESTETAAGGEAEEE
jgi:large subunit ribosomal protein L10